MNQLGNEIRSMVPFEDKKVILVQDHDTKDIISWITKIHPKTAPLYDQISEMHWKGDAEKTAKHLFDFCRKNIVYRIETADDQTIKKPGAILNHGYGDCKHYASYIVGVCDSLNRMGYPIGAKYRFSADRPGMEVHHVFAVVTGPGGGEYWTDPVLSQFNKRSSFHNVKDRNMSLSLISGSSNDDNNQDPEINGFFDDVAKGFKNTVQKISHGADVAWKDTKKGVKYAIKDTGKGLDIAIKKAGKGIEYAANDTKKGIDIAIKETGKGIKYAAKDVKNAVLNVGLSPARNAFLAMVDFNLFNLAKHLNDTIHSSRAGALDNKWKDLGGSPSKLRSAVHNGIKFYNKSHANKIVGATMGASLADAVKFYQANTYTWQPTQIPHTVRRGKHVFKMRGHTIGCTGCSSGVGCSGNAIGCLPACAPALIALASAIIAALKSFLNMSPEEEKQMASGATTGAKEMIDTAAAGVDIATGEQGSAAAAALNNLVKNSVNTPTMDVSTGLSKDGEPELNVHSVDHPLVNQAGKNIDENGDNAKPAPGSGFMSNLSHMFDGAGDKVKQIWTDYKEPILFTTAGIIAFKSKRVRKALRIK